MIFRNKYQLQGFTQNQLDKQDRQRNLLQEQNPQLYETVLNQKIENKFYQTPQTIYQEEFNQNQQELQSENEPFLLKKFQDIMDDVKQKDTQSVKSSQKQSYHQSSQANSDLISVYSINESKFGDLLLQNPNIKYKDVQRLIKDNFQYFKHIFGYCICYKSQGMQKCTHIQSGTKKIKFRGNFITLYSQQFQENQMSKTDQFFNQNLYKEEKQQKHVENAFENRDKVQIYLQNNT